MATFCNYGGTSVGLFALGILSTDSAIANHSDGVSVTDFTGGSLRNARVRDAGSAPSGNYDDCAATYREVKRNNINVLGGFLGAVGPAGPAGYYICNQAGGGYFQGQIVYWDGVATPTTFQLYEGMLCSPRAPVVLGAFQMFANGLYLLTAIGVGPVYTWTLVGDGAPSSVGVNMSIEIPFTFADWPGLLKSSTAVVPVTARVVRSMVVVTTPFVNVGGPSTISTVDIGGATILRTATDQNLMLANQYDVQTVVPVTSAGVVTINFDATAPTAGAGYLIVEYVTPNV